ncbi:LysR substrate-binding domain-containing protein [Gordonia sp. (in: high G+C Gram-positive bacteria)]|uniref:LysR substrate-binding domain-containing protein n=1 Tax=Gordonia sp. (in: high G+C Gram-positive bacteria) TaxID=84139 RepID=UPI0016910701|nr:LysR substrate-binding domain-containing protein [Gordonia sp. (in: high G+C Gram-positive bacteria)]NLG46277.1 LysR family transcriptional regulator [Gordonia sp. (in: high G+C Gram-positive bacteria)]
MEVSLHRLKLLRELRHRGTVTAVADALHYSASAVSQQLAQLEREAQTPLFQRHGRRIVLTEAGRVLADHSEDILDAVESAGNAIESLRGGSTATLHVGVWASVATGLLPTGLALLADRAPALGVRTVELEPESGFDAVRDGSLDLSFVIDYSNYVMPRVRTLERTTVAVERMWIAAAAGTFGGEPMELVELAARGWILSDPRSHFGRAVRLVCREAGFEPDVQHTVGEQSTALALAAAGLGVTLVSDLGAHELPDGVELTPLAGHFQRNLSLTYRARDAGREALRLFIDAMIDGADKIGLGEAR